MEVIANPGAKVVVWEHPLSPYAQKVKMALREKGVDFETRMPSGIGVGTTDDAFGRASPRREVPAFIDGDVAIFDSRIIVDYIEEKWPTPPLLPPAPADRARCRMIEEAVDTQLEAIGWGLMELRVFQRGDEAQRAQLEAEAQRQITQFHAFLTRHLGDRPFFAADIFGRPDMAALPHLLASAKPADGSALAAWVARCMARESAKLTTAESQASLAGMAQVGEAVKAGLFKRQYRDHRLEWMMRSGGVEIVRDGMATNTIRFSTELL